MEHQSGEAGPCRTRRRYLKYRGRRRLRKPQRHVDGNEDKNYAADLLAAGILAERIYKLGFAFAGKD